MLFEQRNLSSQSNLARSVLVDRTDIPEVIGYDPIETLAVAARHALIG
jgi:hypothetical protein